MNKKVWLFSLLMHIPALMLAQTPRPIPAQPQAFEALSDSHWIRVSAAGYPRREAKLLAHDAAGIVLDVEPRPLRIPIAAIDTLWERRTAGKTGALVGGLLGAGIGVLVATQNVEEGESPPADWIGVFAVGGAVGGGLLGALVGRAFPKWHRRHP